MIKGSLTALITPFRDSAVDEAAFRKLVERKVIRADHRVVVISTAHGLKFAEQKTAYHLKQIEGVSSRYANHPLEIAADLPKVMDAIKRYAETVDMLGA